MHIGFSAKTCLLALSAFSMWPVRNTGGVTSATTSAGVCRTLSIASSPKKEVSPLTFQTSSGFKPLRFAKARTLLPQSSILSEYKSPAAIISMFLSAASIFCKAPVPRPPQPTMAIFILSEPFAAPNENLGIASDAAPARAAVFMKSFLVICNPLIFGLKICNMLINLCSNCNTRKLFLFEAF